MSEDLVSKLRAALLHYEVRLDPVPPRPQLDDPNDPTLAYISRMLLDDDEEEAQAPVLQFQESYQNLMAELGALVSPDGTRPQHFDNILEQHDADVEESKADLLKFMLLKAAKAVAANRGSEVYGIVREIRNRALAEDSSDDRTALFFADALLARFTGFGPQVYTAMLTGLVERHMVHVRILNLPSFRVSQRFANHNILELSQDAKRIHIIDYGIQYGCQWPVFIKFLAQRPQGPPAIRITGIDFPRVNVKETERRLTEFAKEWGVSLDFESIVSSSWELVQPSTHVDDLLIVNCNFRLRHLREDGSVGHNPRKLFFDNVYNLRPDVFIQCVMDSHSNMSSPFFVQRFEESVHHYFAKMEMFKALLRDMPEEYTFMGNVLAKSIMNVVACEGVDRVERLNSYRSWDSRARKAGFVQRSISPRTIELVKEAWTMSVHNGNLRMGMDENWLLLGWKNTIMYAMSSWRPKTGRNSKYAGL